MLPGKTYSSNEIGRIIGRHWWLLLLPFAIGLTAGVVVYKQMPVRVQVRYVDHGCASAGA